MPQTGSKSTILYLCTGNSCRSQMAEAWTNHLQAHIFRAFSAGVNPGRVDPLAVEVMAEAGLDISGHVAKGMDTLEQQDFDYVVTVCDHAREACPFFPGSTNRIHRSFEDPPRLAEVESDEKKKLDHYRRIRDEIRDFVNTLPEALNE